MTKLYKRKLLIAPSDTHCGSPVGLIHPKGFEGRNGFIKPTAVQKILWKQFEKSADQIRALRTKDTQLIVAINGDSVEGIHHNNHQVSSPYVDEHEGIFADVLDWYLNDIDFSQSSGDLLYFTAGTESHTGAGWVSENNVARDFGAVPWLKYRKTDDRAGVYTHPRLLLDLFGIKFDIAHHAEAGPGGRKWTRGNMYRSFLRSHYFELVDRREPVPDYFLRSHFHQFLNETVTGKQGSINGFILPALQDATNYVLRRSTSRSNIGVWMATVDSDGKHQWYCDVLELGQSRYKRT